MANHPNRNKPYQYALVYAYSVAGHEQGEVISRHRSLDSAQRAARKHPHGGFVGIRACDSDGRA